jgi:hypothetical protein
MDANSALDPAFAQRADLQRFEHPIDLISQRNAMSSRLEMSGQR